MDLDIAGLQSDNVSYESEGEALALGEDGELLISGGRVPTLF